MSAGPIVVIINPTKFDDLDSVRRELEEATTGSARELRLIETTEDDPGQGQTREALAAGAGVVCALGGDGTVRAVAEVLAGTGVPLGLLPGGTGNLLARNLELPIDSIASAMEVVLTGSDRVIDAGWLEADGGDRHLFTVMAGVGFDAAMMDDAPESVKNKVGWAAYVVAATKHLTDRGFEARVTTEPPAGRSSDGTTEGDGDEQRTRTIIVGNCGQLTGGITLLPDARIDDGVLDLAVLTPTRLTQWAALATRVLAGDEDGGPSLERRQVTSVEVTLEPAQPIEVDGDVLDPATRLRFSIDPGALVVRVPQEQAD